MIQNFIIHLPYLANEGKISIIKHGTPVLTHLARPGKYLIAQCGHFDTFCTKFTNISVLLYLIVWNSLVFVVIEKNQLLSLDLKSEKLL